MREFEFKSTVHYRQEQDKDMIPAFVERIIKAEKDKQQPSIYHISIFNPASNDYTMAPKAMKIVNDQIIKITLEGITENDPDNIWGCDFSDYGIQFIQSAISNGNPGTAVLWLKDRDIVITYQ